jgi:hypothetical protein
MLLHVVEAALPVHLSLDLASSDRAREDVHDRAVCLALNYVEHLYATQ